MDNTEKARNFGGCAVLAAMGVGIAAVALAWQASKAGHFEGAALALLAAAIAFVGVANAIFRH
ncbi:MAG TPA: hypothetical protein VLC46_09355 [Thermoanaerobaculia bacterium]|jgi:hypothetical protein|nr:hypothetical protein [Thermoanaerobaculia bacterium]